MPLIPAKVEDLWVWGQPGLQFQDSQEYAEKPCLTPPPERKKEKKKKERVSQREVLRTKQVFVILELLRDDGSVGAGEMAQRSKALAAFAEDLDLMASTHVSALNYL